MKTWTTVLTGLLTLQLGLALAVNLIGDEYAAFQPTEALLAFNRTAVNELQIEDAEGSVHLALRDGRWVLPEEGGYPADQNAVSLLLERLAGLKKGWPVATTAGAVKRFEVAEEAFQRRLSLRKDGELQASFYLGTSPGFRKVHARPGGDEAVYAVPFNSWDANASADDWIDKSILAIDTDKIERVELPTLVIERNGEQLQVTNLTDNEQTDEVRLQQLIDQLAGLQVQSLLGSESKPEYGLDAQALEIHLSQEGKEVLTYRFAKPKGESYYVLKRSDLDYYFKVSGFTVTPILDTTRTTLVRAGDEKKQEDSAGHDSAAESGAG